MFKYCHRFFGGGMMMIIPILVLLLFIYLFIRLINDKDNNNNDRLLEELKLKYINGEIDESEYLHKKSILKQK